MRRAVWGAVVLGAVLALAGCGQGQTKSDAQPGAHGSGGAGPFPNLFQASFRAEARLASDEGAGGEVVTIRSGKKMRMEFSAAAGRMIQVYDLDAQTAYMLIPAQRTAMRITFDQVRKSPDEAWAEWVQQAKASTTGPCHVAGENGTGWTMTDEGGAIRTTCVTGDGIILRATDGDRVIWETTSIQRGPQDASLFSVPAGYRIVDLSELTKGMGPAMEALKRQGIAQ